MTTIGSSAEMWGSLWSHAPRDWAVSEAQQGRMYDWAGESQYYVEPKRLARLGYLDARREPGRTRERTVYTLNDRGLAALRELSLIHI